MRADAGRLIARTHHGFVCANAGVDQSNAGGEAHAVLLPADPDASARALRARLGCAVVVTDSFGRAWRVGQAEVAIGCAGPGAARGLARAARTRGGRVLHATVDRRRRRGRGAPPTSSAARTRGEPAVRLRGLARTCSPTTARASAARCCAPPEQDLFG